MPINDPAVKAAKPAAKPWKLFDEKGLFLLIQPHGSKLWRIKYRFADKDQLLGLGSYPEVSLKQAREKRQKIREQVWRPVSTPAPRGKPPRPPWQVKGVLKPWRASGISSSPPAGRPNTPAGCGVAWKRICCHGWASAQFGNSKRLN
ncbi:MAG: Arm DNA-binding domain-containing protein, partial [Candidatus Competibacter sp.]